MGADLAAAVPFYGSQRSAADTKKIKARCSRITAKNRFARGPT
jgi:hypothetical protein